MLQCGIDISSLSLGLHDMTMMMLMIMMIVSSKDNNMHLSFDVLCRFYHHCGTSGKEPGSDNQFSVDFTVTFIFSLPGNANCDKALA